MWIKSLDEDVWVNMNHITHFSIVRPTYDYRIPYHEVTAFLNASAKFFSPSKFNDIQDQASLIVYRGTREECEQFINEQ